MSQYVFFRFNDDSENGIFVEVSDDFQEPDQIDKKESEGEGWTDAGLVDRVRLSAQDASVTLTKAMENARTGVEAVLNSLTKIRLAEAPNEIEIEFGLKLDAKAGAIVAQAGAEVNYKVKLVWKRNTNTSSEKNNNDTESQD